MAIGRTDNKRDPGTGTVVQTLSWDKDGSPFSDRFGDHFFSVDGGLAESRHVFLDGNGLPERWADRNDFSIAELGFGTGLNFLETWRQWTEVRRDGQHLTFTSFEAFPLEALDIERAIARWPGLTPLAAHLLEHWPDLSGDPTKWAMDKQTTLQVVRAPALEGVQLWQGRADAWYLDGFSPAKNPDMWSDTLTGLVFERTVPGGTFATYTVAGWVRRNLQNAGFSVARTPGFGRKREMMTGLRPRAETEG